MQRVDRLDHLRRESLQHFTTQHVLLVALVVFVQKRLELLGEVLSSGLSVPILN